MPHPRWNIPIWELLATPDGQGFLAFGPTFELRLWNWDAKLVRTFAGHDGKVAAAAFLPDGRHLVSAGGRQILVWDWTTGERLGTLNAGSAAHAMAVTPNGAHVISGHGDHGSQKRFSVWNLQSMKRSCEVQTGLPIDLLRIDRAGERLLSAPSFSHGHCVLNAWKLVRTRPQVVALLERHRSPVVAAGLSADGKTAVSSDDLGEIRVWDIDGQKCRAQLEGHRGRVRALALVAGDQRLVSADSEGTVRIWRLDSGACERAIEDLPPVHHGVSFSVLLDGTRAAAAGGGRVVLLDLEQGAIVEDWSVERPSGCLLSGGRVAVALESGEVRVLGG